MAVKLRALGVVKVLGGTRVLRGLDASLDGAAVHVVEGPNGSGKSTLLSILAGRTRPSSGRVFLQEGESARAEGPGLRDSVGWLGHDLGLYGDLDVFANVALHASLRGLAPQASWNMVAAELEVEALRDRRARELSRGQRQRVALARTLLGSPAVLLLDEPSTGLDARSTERLAGIVCRVRAQGTIVAVVTHDPAFADALEPVRWVMRDGKLYSRE